MNHPLLTKLLSSEYAVDLIQTTHLMLTIESNTIRTVAFKAISLNHSLKHASDEFGFPFTPTLTTDERCRSKICDALLESLSSDTNIDSVRFFELVMDGQHALLGVEHKAKELTAIELRIKTHNHVLGQLGYLAPDYQVKMETLQQQIASFKQLVEEITKELNELMHKYHPTGEA